MNSKHFIMFLILLATANAAEPPEITQARARYNAALAAAAKPVHDKYIQELQQLKSRAFALKRLDLAVAVDNELKALGVANNAIRSDLPQTSGLQPLAQMLPGTQWSASRPKGRWLRVEFTSESKLILVDKTGPVGGSRSYEISEDGNSLQFKFVFGDVGNLVFSKNHREFELLGDTFKQDKKP